MAALPHVPGPKLPPFDTKGQPLHIKFICELGKGLHSVVWKVCINEEVYALKIFNGFTESMDLGSIVVSDDDCDCYVQPFENECRAFGRLEETGNAHLAIRCHGYVFLGEDDVAFLKTQYDWNYVFQEQADDQPVRAIVKEVVDLPPDGASHREWIAARIHYKSATAVIQNLKTLHRIGILVRDVHEDNFLYGKWMDLSKASTVPHPLLDRSSSLYEKTLDEFAVEDAVNIDDFIDTYNERYPEKKIWSRFFANPDYIKKLRPMENRDRHMYTIYWKFGSQKFYSNE